MGTLTNGPVQSKPMQFKTQADGNSQVQVVSLDAETVAALGGSGGGGGALAVEEQQASTVNESVVSASSTIATLLAASSSRRGFRLTVPAAFTGTCGLSTKSNATLSTCPIQLKGGDMWVESLAAASAWYVILDTGTATIPVQALS